MRNCFIPHCDTLHKANPKRAMFNVPMKNPQLLQLWQEVLPKHRPLKTFDRICEIHFQEEDIQRYWEHNINGKLERMVREKPTLRPNAVPIFIDIDVKMLESAGSPIKERVKRKCNKKIEDVTKNKLAKLGDTSEVYSVEYVEQQTAVQSIVNQNDLQNTSVLETSVQKINDTINEQNVEHNIVIETTHSSHPDFETLFDEIYEVQLPSTLWGVHRDAEKTFISFTEFNKDTMNIRKYLYIDQFLQYRMAVGQRIMKSGALSNASTEAITELLDKLDQIKIRKVIIKGSSSILNES